MKSNYQLSSISVLREKLNNVEINRSIHLETFCLLVGYF